MLICERLAVFPLEDAGVVEYTLTCSEPFIGL
jgi:hypothetical protein